MGVPPDNLADMMASFSPDYNSTSAGIEDHICLWVVNG
ncbi:MAG: hypothetical protein OJF52_002240 [Nitrospira sp.]|nr:MAG: hypothetical protein OJF52_002240 [Nitrospira sp.]